MSSGDSTPPRDGDGRRTNEVTPGTQDNGPYRRFGSSNQSLQARRSLSFGGRAQATGFPDFEQPRVIPAGTNAVFEPLWTVPAHWKDLPKDPKGRPQVEHCFSTDLNRETQERFCDTVSRCVQVVDLLNNVNLAPHTNSIKARKGKREYGGSYVGQYRKGCYRNIIAILCVNASTHFVGTNSNQYSVENLRAMAERVDGNGDDELQWWTERHYNLLVYLFEYVVPKDIRREIFNDTYTRDLTTAKEYLMKASTFARPMWSYQFLAQGRKQLADKNIFRGHNYYVAILIDRICDGGIEKVILEHNPTPNQHYITQREHNDWLTANDGHRFWQVRKRTANSG